MRRTQLLRTSRGFSLVEVLIVLLVMFIIGGALIEIMVSQFRLTASHNRNIINQADLRDVMVFMSDEISLTGTAVTKPVPLDPVRLQRGVAKGDLRPLQHRAELRRQRPVHGSL